MELSLLVDRLTNEKKTVAARANGGGAGAGRPHEAQGMGRGPRANKIEGRGRAAGGRARRSLSRSCCPAGKKLWPVLARGGECSRVGGDLQRPLCASPDWCVSCPGRC